MIDRYSVPEMAAIWTDESRFARWLEIEILAVEARVSLGQVPREDLEAVRMGARFDAGRIAELERTTRHDVAAFVACVSESLGPESRHIHWGMTSSDVLDTALALQVRDSAALIASAAADYDRALASLVRRTRGIPCIGRTHGMHAEPVTLALKFAGHLAECRRASERFSSAAAEAAVGKLSGAVGTYAHLDPSVESYVMEKLGLRAETVSTQVVPRDRIAAFVFAIASLGTAMERFATEVRHLQRSEVAEVEEAFARGQKGSSAMPHKRNPVQSERLCGLSRLLRAYVPAALENSVLWHERDISHSSAERFMLPDACGIVLYMLQRASELAEGLRVMPGAVARNLSGGGDGYSSQSVMLALIDRGLSREEAYGVVQAAATRASEAGTSFASEIALEPAAGEHLGEGGLAALCSIERHLRNEDLILGRLGL